ncbi:MAG TPA: hypothetical protein DER68_03140 [Ruminococcaceae bacterium]|nr:hypothetical protein [Oscillospiraceae bacterium]
MKKAKIIMLSALALIVAGAAVLAAVFGKKTEENAPKTEFLFSLWGGDVGWEDTRGFAVPEYEDAEFLWTADRICANGETLIWGMPVWNVYLSDLNGDGKREIISEVSIGSGIVDDRIIAYDFSEKRHYALEKRFYSNFSLFLNNGELWVREKKYGGDEIISERKLALSEMKEYDGTF